MNRKIEAETSASHAAMMPNPGSIGSALPIPHDPEAGQDGKFSSTAVEGCAEFSSRGSTFASGRLPWTPQETNAMTQQTPPPTAPSAATRLARLILNDKFVDLFRDPEGRTYVDVYERPGQLETFELPSPAANEWLRRRQYKIGAGALSTIALGEVVGLLRAKALYQASPTVPVFARVGEVNGTIFIDRGAPDWEVVRIDAHGWDLISYGSCPVRFRRDPQMAELPRPVRGGSIELLRRFANVAEADWPLVAGFLVASLRPRGPYPLLALIGGQGDGKSTTARVLQRLIDPRKGDLHAPPRDRRDLAAIAHGCWLPAFDNLSSLSAQLSDALCRLATGGTFGGRQLYTDFEQASLRRNDQSS